MVTSKGKKEDIDRNIILQRLSGEMIPDELIGLEEQQSTLKKILNTSLTCYESNSLLLMGPSGSGKSVLLKKCIKEVENETKLNFIKIELDGMIHQNARESILSIAQQLRINYTIEEEEEDNTNFSLFNALQFILNEIAIDGKKNNLLITLDNMDLFAMHPKQTLLYNLFDLVQKDTKVNLCVVGITCKMDTVDLLEKRVKSRFSHRQIYFRLPSNIDGYFQILKNALLLLDNKQNKEFNQKVEDLLKDNNMVALFEDLVSINPSISYFLDFVYNALLLSDFTLTYESFENNHIIQDYNQDQVILQLQSLNVLELTLLVAIQKLMLKDIFNFNFELIYQEYSNACNKRIGFSSLIIRPKSKVEVQMALDHLISLELVISLDKNSKKNKDYQMLKTDLLIAQIKKAVLIYPDCPSFLTNWVKY